MIAKCNTCPYDKQECFSRACGVNLEVCIKRYAEENYPIYIRLSDEVKSNRYDLLHLTAERDTLQNKIDAIEIRIKDRIEYCESEITWMANINYPDMLGRTMLYQEQIEFLRKLVITHPDRKKK